MAESSLFVGERSGARIFRVGRIGFDSPGDDLGSHTYTGTFRTERIFPVGPGGLVNFRRVAIHILASGTYTFTVKVWVDGARTQLADGSTQTVTVTGGEGALNEITEEVEIEAEGSHIQVEVTVDSDATSGLFLIEGIDARGRVIRRSETRSGDAQ